MWRWFMKIGSPGATARWAAKTWKFVRSSDEYAHAPASEAVLAMIAVRYWWNPTHPRALELMRMADAVKGLRGLVGLILSVEANLLKCDDKHIHQMLDVVFDELARKGIPIEDIEGIGWPCNSAVAA